ncbi:leucine-rich repeat-containing protein 42 [Galendromus occidentalis]|uniref:Leucine-rich repeat-containing protein 42 n=1 Tax=Galendromus occidentalis TaxID=34638 RepID=A0AAJ6QSC9_9ACAR|nr:leucine-rich repeat-containing protein 42 [Galendromus occidentalis]
MSSLEDLCVDFISSHCEWVDSWDGVPDYLSKKVFFRMVDKGCVDFTEDACIRLKPFRDTYGILLQSRVNFSQQSAMFFSEILDIYELIADYIAFLDLSKCKLGSGHPVFASLVYFHNLRCLVMSECALNDDSLRRLTLPISMRDTGAKNLLMLDISNNPQITSRSIPKIKVFRKLKKLNIRGTQIAADSLDIETMPTIEVHNNGWISESGLWDRWNSILEGPRRKKRHF